MSHTGGRVWGVCWDARSVCIFTLLANASWFSDVWQRDDALGARWGCSSFSGQHAMRGGQTLFKQCSVTECNVHFSQGTPLHCQSWISSWRFLKLALSVLCCSGRCFIFTALQSASGSSVCYLESALPQYLALLSCLKCALPRESGSFQRWLALKFPEHHPKSSRSTRRNICVTGNQCLLHGSRVLIGVRRIPRKCSVSRTFWILQGNRPLHKLRDLK